MDLIFEPQKGRPFTIEVGFFDTVLEIKQKVEKYQSIPVSDQTLVFNDRVLSDDDDITSCVLLHNSRINLIITEAPSSPPNTPKTHIVTIEMNVNETALNPNEMNVSSFTGRWCFTPSVDRCSLG